MMIPEQTIEPRRKVANNVHGLHIRTCATFSDFQESLGLVSSLDSCTCLVGTRRALRIARMKSSISIKATFLGDYALNRNY